jgi:nucleoid-associated protein Lsr2
MATKVVTLDDLDGVSESAETIIYLLDGQYLEIDLSSDNAKKFRDGLSKYVKVSRPVPAKEAARRIMANANGNGASEQPGEFDPAVVRAWALERGHNIGDKGRVPQHLVTAWRQDQASSTSAST